MSVRGLRPRLAVVAVAALATVVTLTSCQKDGGASESTDGDTSVSGDSGTEVVAAPAAKITANVDAGASDVKVSTPVRVKVADGTFDSVVFTQARSKKSITGSFNADQTAWTATDLLEPGTDYTVVAAASNADGQSSRQRVAFSTQNLSLDEQTYANLSPLNHETVGVGMPVIVQFDIPVKRKADFERHMKVTAKPATVGSWSWLSDTEVHWRPKHYWKSGTKVHVDLDVNGLDAGNGIYGQMSRTIDFQVGQSVILKTDLASHQMRVMVNGQLARTIPITGGKPGFETRSGTKLIIEKFAVKQMNAATVGIEPGDPEYYNIPDVQYAQRVTFSGEFLHAAPWSVASQGSYNVSHGCVGMSTDNGAWLFSLTHRGDPVEVTGTARGLEDGNGWTDWNESYQEFKTSSALD